MKKLLIGLFFLVGYFVSSAQDTGEIRNVKEKNFKVHKVQAGETVFALSRNYEVSTADILLANPSAKDGLSIGQELLIPFNVKAENAVMHKVEPGETLFAISKKYNVDIEEIQRLNGMNDVALDIGQNLIIKSAKKENVKSETASNDTAPTEDAKNTQKERYTVLPGETLFSISRKFNISVENIVEWNNLEGSAINPGQELVVGNTKKVADSIEQQTVENKEKIEEANQVKEAVTKVEKEDSKPDTIIDTTPTTTDNFVEVTEKGVAELIPDTETTRKYLALHREVQPGTIIRVRNEMNGREVWARVIGKLPETGENKDILVKVSKAAFDRLGAVDKKFRVTITYIP